jgi:thymidylate synthase (FAD)
MTVELVQKMGDDETLCKAARVSTLGTASLETTESSGLLNFLMKGRHGSPFEHGSMTFLIEAPIFVFREFHRHRVGWSYNETSGRYRQLEPVFYVPPTNRPLKQVGKAGEYSFEPGTSEQRGLIAKAAGVCYGTAWSAYKSMLAEGVAKEVARMVLPVGIYSSMYATCNPRSLMHFLSLRTTEPSPSATFPSHPQYEIELVARQMEFIFADLFPLTTVAWNLNGRVAP